MKSRSRAKAKQKPKAICKSQKPKEEQKQSKRCKAKAICRLVVQQGQVPTFRCSSHPYVDGLGDKVTHALRPEGEVRLQLTDRGPHQPRLPLWAQLCLDATHMKHDLIPEIIVKTIILIMIITVIITIIILMVMMCS